MKREPGKVYLVGAGPGDPGLLTLRARALLEKAEEIFYDHLVHPGILSLCGKAALHYVGKVGHGSCVSQDKIEQELVSAAGRATVVVRLKGGDPFVFGRGGEEAEALARAGIEFEVVPGVTSAIAVPAYAGIPLTHRAVASSFTVVTGHEDPQKGDADAQLPWESLAKQPVLVFLMAVKTLKDNLSKLIEAGRSKETPAALISWGTYARQKTWVGTLETLPGIVASGGAEPPAVVVVGEVVRHRETLNWFESKPLFGRRVLITRTQTQASKLSSLLWEWGAEPIEVPCLEIREPTDSSLIEKTLRDLSPYDWILFTSGNGVDFFFSWLKRLKLDQRGLAKLRFGVVGTATAASLAEYGYQADLVPETFSGKALAEALAKNFKARKILLPRVGGGSEEILAELRDKHLQVEELVLYERALPAWTEAQKQWMLYPSPDLLTFASSETVKNFITLLEKFPELSSLKSIPSVVIGPRTKETAQDLGLKVVAMPEESSLQALADSIFKYFKGL